MVLMAKSGTTTMMLIGATAVLGGQHFIWRPAAGIRHARTLVALLIVSLCLIAALLMFGFFQVDVFSELLGALGKDTTLTGRTMLWDLSKRVMEDHPWTGLGANGFWRPENGVANTVFTDTLQGGPFTGFSFHSSYYENGANYGYPGFWATVFLSTWALTSAVLNWIRNQSTVNATFLVFAALIVMRSTSEADLAGEFSGTAVLLFIAAARKEKRIPKLPAFSGAPTHAAAAGQARS